MNNKTLKPGWRWVKFGDVVRLSKARSQDPLADGIERYVSLEHLNQVSYASGVSGFCAKQPVAVASSPGCFGRLSDRRSKFDRPVIHQQR